MISENGEIASGAQAAVVKLTNANYSKIEIKLTSIPKDITVNCNAYYVVDGKVNYICGKEILDIALGKTL